MELSAVEIVYIVVMSVGAVCSSILSFFSMKRSGKTSKEVLSLCEKTDSVVKKMAADEPNSAAYLDEFSRIAQSMNDSGMTWSEMCEFLKNRR